PETRRGGDFPGLQPRVLAERALEADERRPRARRRARAAEIQHRRVPTATRRVEGGDLQRVVRRHVQRHAARARPPVRVAPARVLPHVTINFAKAHAYGNDFIYVRADAVDLASAADLARQLCDRHTGIGGDGLILYTPTADGASMRLFN